MAKRREQLKDSEKRSLNKSNFKKLLGIFRFIVPYKTRFIMGMICLIFGSVILLSFPYLAGKLVDVASGKLWLLGTISQVEIDVIAVLLMEGESSVLRGE